MLPAALLLTLALAHGGQYLPPFPDPDQPEPATPFVQPGFGPVLDYQPGRWEWWFDFNQEGLLRLRERMAARSSPDGQFAYAPVTDDDRSRRLLPLFVDALRDHHRNVRSAAVMALAHLARPDVVPYIEVMLEDPDLFVRVQSVIALGVSGQPGAVETLADLLGDRDTAGEMRIFAAAALGLVGDQEAVDVLFTHLTEKALARENNLLRAGLVYGAGVSASPLLADALVGLRKSWLWESEPDLRALAAVALGQIGAPAGLPLLLELSEDDDNQVRRSAAAGLSGVAGLLDPDQVAALAAHVEHESDLPARFDLLRVLGRSRSDTGRQALRAAFVRANSLMRPHAALALGLDGDPGNAPLLLAALPDQHELSVRAALVVSLGLLGDPEAVDPLLGLLERAREPTLLGYLGLSLGLIGVDREGLRPRLEDLASTSHDVEVVRLTTIGLGLLGDREALGRLAAGVSEVQGTVDRAARLHALGWVGDRTLLEPLMAVVDDEQEPSYVVAYALQALGEIADPRPLPPAWRLSHQVELNHDVSFLFELYRLL